MAFFKSTDPTTVIQRKLDNRRTEHTNAVALLAEQEREHNLDATAAQAVSDAGGDQATLTRANTKKNISLANVASRKDTVAKFEAEIAVLVADLAKAVEIKTRGETDIAAKAILTDFTTFMDELGAVLAKGEPAVRKLAAFAPEMKALHTFIVTTREQIPDAKSLGCRLGQDYVNAVKLGSVPASLKQPEAPPPKLPPVARPQLTTVFSWHALTWRDEHNQQRIVAKWREVDLPQAAAAFALQAGLALLNTDPRCNAVRNQSPAHPEAGWLNNLDTKTGPNIPDTSRPAADPILASSPFQVVDRGEPKIIQIKAALR